MVFFVEFAHILCYWLGIPQYMYPKLFLVFDLTGAYFEGFSTGGLYLRYEIMPILTIEYTFAYSYRRASMGLSLAAFPAG